MKNNNPAILLHNVKMISQENVKMATYTCPMHPELTSDKPGKCPKCGMELVKKN